jgi:hypothetical protein
MYSYDYGYSTNPYNKKKTISIQPGDNLFSLGGKVDTSKKVQTHLVEFDNEQAEDSFSETVNIVKKISFDPVEYMHSNNIKCKKFNYSVPQSYDDKKALIKMSSDEKCLDIYNLTNDETDGLIKQIPIDEITGFIYGSFSTRFWMMRIGINQ